MDRKPTQLSGTIVDLHRRRVLRGTVFIQEGVIQSVQASESVDAGYLLPGLVDAHVHIESSMLVPSAFARLAVVHGTVATVSDPHEIANVLGVPGVRYMIEDGRRVPVKFHFGAPSCVPATTFETSGATIGPAQVDQLLEDPDIYYLAEMMNYPGVLHGDDGVWQKIKVAKRHGKPIDGHAPLVRGAAARKYVEAGISTDHECASIEEAREKLSCGMKILVREGSAAKNFDDLIELLPEHHDQMMFCSDDKHPDDLVEGHIDQLVRRALGKGMDPLQVLSAACANAVSHYGLKVGLLAEGDPADLIRVDNLKDFNVLQTYIDGCLVANRGRSLIEPIAAEPVNRFEADKKTAEDFRVRAESRRIRVIEAVDGDLITHSRIYPARVEADWLVPDVEQDILKIVVVNRYRPAPVSVAFVKNFGLARGAIASSVAHDSHNIIAVGADDISLSRAVNRVIEHRGGVAAADAHAEKVLPLPIAGLMSDQDGCSVGREYAELSAMVKRMGSGLRAPLMTLSFMGLLVIPSLKLSDQGLFDGERFQFTPLCV